MKITLTEQHIILAPYLYLGSIFRVEQHSICGLDSPDIGSHRNHLTPREPAADCHSRWDQDATATAPLARLVVGGDQHTIIQHPDGECAVIQHAGVRGAVLI